MIHNNNLWKGFFPIDQDFTLVRVLWRLLEMQGINIEGQVLKGITHPFDASQIFAPNLPQIQKYPGNGR